jgi:hypothetical protein
MQGARRIPRIPLPEGWPKRIRSAVIEAISLALRRKLGFDIDVEVDWN